MIAVINVEITAANPSMPLFPWRAYVNSPSSLRIRNVPRRVGNWNIDKVYVNAAYPDNSIKSAECVLVGGVWVCTIAGSTSTGFSQNGYTIFADGEDENGNDVTGYILGKGDITILEADGAITPSEGTHYVHMLDDVPTSPKEGDLWNDDGTWYIYQDGTSYPIGDDSGLIQQLSERVDGVETTLTSKADKSQLASYELKADMQNDVSSIVTAKETEWIYPDEINGYLYAPSYQWVMANGDRSKTYYNIETPVYTEYGWHVHGDLLFWFDEGGIWDVASVIDTDVDAPEDAKYLNVPDEEPAWGAFTIIRDEHNTLGLAMISDLETKQDKLLDQQISAINSVVDERATVITFTDNTTSVFNWSGEITRQTLIDASLFDRDEDVWIKSPVSVKIGTAVTAIGEYAFGFAYNLSSVTIPDSVISIGTFAFSDCVGLLNVTILDNGLHNLKTIGDYAFQGCRDLTYITLPQGVEAIGVDAFAGTYTYFKLYLEEATPAFVPSTRNYPWGISIASNIITVRNASKEWVEEQGYGKGFAWRNATVNARLHTCTMYAFNINAMTLSTAVASFKVTMNTTAYNTARDLYFSLTLGNFTQPMTWDTPFDVFKGGSAEAVAPTEGLNFYHIFEYASGHFMVEKII